MLAHLRGPAADDNDAEAHHTEPGRGLGPRSRSHSYTGDIKARPVEGSTGQMDLVGRIADLCEFIPTNVFFFSSWKGMLLMCVCVCVYVCVRVCTCSSCFHSHIRYS